MQPSLFLALFPALLYASLVLLLYRPGPAAEGRGLRVVVLTASVALWLIVLVATEILSLVHAFRFEAVATAWIAGTVLILALALRRQRAQAGLALPSVLKPPFVVACIAAVAGLMAVLAVLACVAPPNTWDSMTYHLPRACHWIQNRSLAHYPTHNLRQLYHQPLAEIGLAHILLLTGSDRLVNLLQWSAMAAACVAASLIAVELGAGVRGQALAGLLTATLPMGLLQATSTQNDAITALLLAALVYASLRLQHNPSIGLAAAVGTCAGLATVCKATSYIYAAPFLLWAVVTLLRAPWPWSRRLAATWLLGLLLVGVNLGHFARNLGLFGSPLGPRRGQADIIYLNETMTPAAWLSNLLRNGALHMQTPWDHVANGLFRQITAMHERLGMDVNDPRTTFAGTRFHYGLLSSTTSADLSGNTVHAALAMATLALVLVGGRHPRLRELRLYGASLLLAWLLFSVLLKWQPWHSRLHLPLFVLAAGWTAAAWERICPARWHAIIAALLLVLAIPWLVRNQSRPLAGRGNVFTRSRLSLYFLEQPNLQAAYVETVRRIAEARVTRVDLVLSSDDWEYPLWMLLREARLACSIHHANVRNVSRRLARPEPTARRATLLFHHRGRTIDAVLPDAIAPGANN